MKYESLKIKDVKILKPEIYRDKRGYFYESFNEKIMNKIIGKKIHFVQDNQSFSKKNVLRGMHFQLTPVAQAKLVRVIFGKIYDVAVDLRNGSKTFGKWVGKILSDVNRNQLWIPEGFAHGFYCLEDSLVQYKTTNFFSSNHDQSLRWNDPNLGIDWPLFKKPILSSRDNEGCYFDPQKIYFT